MAYLFESFPQSIDAFGRYRVSEPTTIFDSKQLADTQPLFWDDAQTAGGGTSTTYNTNQASTTIAVSATTVGTRVRQTFRRFNYQPGKSQLIFMTFVLGAGALGIRRRVGQFDASNGIFVQLDGTALSFVQRTFTSGVASDAASVPQASWNLDPLNGSGPSGINLNTSLTQILVIDYEWLGVGSVRCGFVIDGRIVYAHQFNNANALSLVYMSNPNLPLRYEISNDGSGGAAGLVHICTTVISEGGRQSTGLALGIGRAAAAPLQTNNDALFYPLIAIRLRSGYQFATVIPTLISIICTSAAAFRWSLLLNPTVTGVAFSYTTVTNSAVEADVARVNTTTVSGGTEVATGYGQTTASASTETTASTPSELQLGASIAGVSDVLVLAVSRVTGTTETFFASLNWLETK